MAPARPPTFASRRAASSSSSRKPSARWPERRIRAEALPLSASWPIGASWARKSSGHRRLRHICRRRRPRTGSSRNVRRKTRDTWRRPNTRRRNRCAKDPPAPNANRNLHLHPHLTLLLLLLFRPIPLPVGTIEKIRAPASAARRKRRARWWRRLGRHPSGSVRERAALLGIT